MEDSWTKFHFLKNNNVTLLLNAAVLTTYPDLVSVKFIFKSYGSLTATGRGFKV